jgi:ABC-2 type transport system permease protein
MIVNDFAFVAFWFLFFHRVGSIRGWDAHRVMVLFAILATVTGTALGLLSNARRIGEIVGDGRLDAVLALPVDPLAYLLVRTVDTALLGDLAFGPLLFLLFGRPTVERGAIFLLASACGVVVFVAFMIIVGSLTFFAGGRGEQAELGFQAILILASYPIDIFGGATKLLLFTAIPAAFVSGLPASLVDSFSWVTAGSLVLVAVLFAGLARMTFVAGLRRYRSGALWTRA